jgi:hypothetical protein
MVNDKDYSTGVPSVALEKDTELVDTEVNSVHLVTRGANRKKLHLVKSELKRAPGSNSMAETHEPAFAIDVLKNYHEEGLADKIEKGIPGLQPEAMEVGEAMVTLAKSVAEELPANFFDEISSIAGFQKASTKKAKPTEDDDDDDDDGCDGDDGAQKSKATKMKKSIEKTLEKIEKEEDLDLLPEDVQKAVRPIWKALVEKDERIAKMEEQKREEVFLAKAAQYTRIAKGADFVNLMKDAADYLPEKSFQAFIHLLDAHEEMLRKGDLFAEYGSSLEGDASNPLVRWDAEAKALQKSAGITYEQAYTDVVHADPEGYKEVLNHNLAASRGEF